MKALKLPTSPIATADMSDGAPRRATKLTSENMADRNFDASRPAVLLVGFNSADSNPSSTILATLCGYAEDLTDLESTLNILIRKGVLTGSCPSAEALYKC